MKKKKNPRARGEKKQHSTTRRDFIAGVSGAAAATWAAGAIGLAPIIGGESSMAQAVEIAPTDPSTRTQNSKEIRKTAADNEKALGVFPHPTNGDEELYPNRIGNFSKTLPHDNFGEVDPAAYNALLFALSTGQFADFEAVPKGGTGEYLNPMGGLAFNMEGPDSPATSFVAIPPAFASQAMGAQGAEVYWMAVCRDVPWDNYPTDPLIAAAVADLNSFPAYMGPRPVTPQNIFRYDYPGGLIGPMVSQFVLRDFTYDGIPINGKTRLPRPVNGGDGIEFLTTFQEWLDRLNGVAVPAGAPAFQVRNEADLKYARSVRDLGRVGSSDTIYSTYFRAMIILNGFGGAAIDDGNPYKASNRQGGFATFGGAHLSMLVGSVHKAERHTWYDKWNVHRYLRPDEFGGRLHLVKAGTKTYPIDAQLLNSPVMPLIFEQNRLNNQRRFGLNEGSWLLSQQAAGGSPAHPSSGAGHAVTAGACITALKAWFKEDQPFPLPHFEVTPEGERREVSGGIPGLTIGGELNKLAHNMSAGRDMFGVHWRVADDLNGNFQGEEVAIRLLSEARATYPEQNFTGFTLTKFNGITINV
jgi:hypothetical protein